jgi:outer membrane protein assembly factor BamB
LGTAVPAASQSTPPASPKPPAIPAYEHAWSAPLGSPDPSELIVDGDVVLVSAGDGLTAFDSETGKRSWRVDLEHTAMLASGDGAVFVTMPGRLDALEKSDGRRRWTAALPNGDITGLIVVQGAVIVTAGLELRAYASGEGTQLWQETFAAATAALAADAGKIFVGLVNHHLVTLNMEHVRLSDVELDTGPVQIVAAQERVLVCGSDGALYLHRQNRQNSLIWRVQRVVPVGRPVIDDRHVYVAQFDNTARAYAFSNGTERWRLRLDARPVAGVQIAGANVFFPLLTGAVAIATAKAKTGQPSGVIPVVSASGDAAAAASRLELSALTPDARLLFRVIRPASHRDWSLLAVRLKPAS